MGHPTARLGCLTLSMLSVKQQQQLLKNKQKGEDRLLVKSLWPSSKSLRNFQISMKRQKQV